MCEMLCINGTQYFSSLLLRLFLCPEWNCLSPKKKKNNTPLGQVYTRASTTCWCWTGLFHPSLCSPHSLSHQRTQESTAGLLAIKFICLIFLQIQGLIWMQSLFPLWITLPCWVGGRDMGTVPGGVAAALWLPQTLILGCTEPPAGSASTKAIWAKEAWVLLKRWF